MLMAMLLLCSYSYLQQLETRRWHNEVSVLFLCANAATVKEKADLSRRSGQVVVQQSNLLTTEIPLTARMAQR